MSTENMIAETADRSDEPPLVVDLDGTLLNSDMLAESFFALASTNPLSALGIGCSIVQGRAVLKARLARAIDINLTVLPWNQPFLDYLKRERADGRRIYLASASAQRMVDRVAEYHQLFDGTFGSTDQINLKSAAKAAALTAAFGERGFDYAGNENADLAVWEHARGVLLVNGTPSFSRSVLQRWPNAAIHGSGKITLSTYARAIRVHQWLKNLLVLAPAVAAHRFDLPTMLLGLMAFLSFSLCASSVYVLNDLVDLGRDRHHPRKCSRPFASGAIPTLRGMAMIPILLGAAFVIGLFTRPGFLVVLAGYYGLTMTYSVYLKRRLMIDVVTLACLYGARLVAGSVAYNIELSAWLAAFSLFLFVSLALVKRCTELVGRAHQPETALLGRAYTVADLPMLQSMAAASGFTAVLVLALYINSDTVQMLYSAPHRLWLMCVVMIYWIGRTLMLSHRGVMHDDPVVYASTDRISGLCVIVMWLVVLASL